MSRIWTFVRNAENRAVIAWLGSGLLAALAALGFVASRQPDAPPPAQSAVAAKPSPTVAPSTAKADQPPLSISASNSAVVFNGTMTNSSITTGASGSNRNR